MYQAGIKNITLYENKEISFYHYDPTNSRRISNIAFSGAIIEIENMQLPEFDIEIALLDSGEVGYNYEMKFYLLGLLLDNYATLAQLKTSIYGWKMLIEYYDGTYKFYDTPLFCRDSEINPQEEMSFMVGLKNLTPSTKDYYEYTAGISPTTTFRADTTLLTADTTIYTADYAL